MLFFPDFFFSFDFTRKRNINLRQIKKHKKYKMIENHYCTCECMCLSLYACAFLCVFVCSFMYVIIGNCTCNTVHVLNAPDPLIAVEIQPTKQLQQTSYSVEISNPNTHTHRVFETNLYLQLISIAHSQ